MLQIAICDDEPEQCQLLQALTAEYLSSRPRLEAQVTAFASASAVLSAAEATGGFDLYLLDVLMPEQNGIELGLALRQRDSEAVIIYLTASADFAVDAFLTRAYHYLLKPLSRESLFGVLDEAIVHLNRRDTALSLKTKTGLQRLSLGSIVYAELVGRCISYHLRDGSQVMGLTLRCPFRQGAQALLADRRFVQCGASFVVNLAYVEKLERTTLLLSTGQSLPLSRYYYTAVKNRWLDYCLGGDA